MHDASPQQWDTRNLAEYIRYWLDNHAALRCGSKTLERYRQLAESLVRLLGGVSILDLRPGVTQEAVNSLLLRGGRPPRLIRTDGHLRPRPSTRPHHCYSLLRRCGAPGAHPYKSDGGQKGETPKTPETEPRGHGS